MIKEKFKKIRFSISLKITLAIVIVLIIATSFGTFLEYLHDRKFFLKESEIQTEKIALGLSSAANALIRNNKISSLQTMVEHVALGDKCSSCHTKGNGINQLLVDNGDSRKKTKIPAEVLVISRDFKVIASDQKDLIGMDLESLSKDKRWKHVKAYENIKKVIMNGRVLSVEDKMDFHYEAIIPFKEKGNSGGVVFVARSLENLRKELFSHFLRTLISFLFLSFIAGMFFFIALRKIVTKPLGQLTQRVKMIREGKRPEHLCLNTRDELGFLGNTFNKMAETLMQREGDLLKQNRMTNSLYEISSLISTTLNIQEVLDISLKKVIEVIGVDGGGIFLFDASTYSLLLKASYGLSDEFVNSVRSLKADDGLVGKAFITGKTIALEEIRNTPRSNLDAVKKEGFKAGAYVPLKAKEDKVLGVMAIANKGDKKFSEDEISLLNSIGELIGVAVENALFYEKSEKRANQIEMINKMGKIISETFNVDEIMQIVAEKMQELVPFDIGGIHLFDSSKKRLNFLYLIEDRAITLKKKVDIPLEGTAFEQNVVKKESLLRHDLKEESVFRGERTMFERFGIRSILTVPLISKEEIIGFLSVGRREPNVYTEENMKLLEIIGLEIATSIHNARLFGNVIKAKTEWENTFDSITDLISIHDKEFNILRVNKTLADKFNIEPNELIGKKCYEIFHCKKEPLKNCPHKKVIDTGKYCEGEIDGEGLFKGSIFLISASPFFNYEGKIIGSVHMVRDITEKKISEKELIESNKKLKETLEKLQAVQEQLLQSDKLAAVGQLVSGVAHELNNPLTSVIGYSQLLMMKIKDEHLIGDVEKVFNEANRAAKIVGNLLTFARQKKLEKDYIDINEVIIKTLELKAYEMKVTNIEVIAEFDRELPKTMADFQQLQQVFLNIIINAEQAMIEAHNRGRFEVKTEVIRRNNSGNGSKNPEEEKEFIRISFKDDGLGIPEKNLKKIFDPFFTTKAIGKGTGLGLSLSYGIIKEHDGRICAENNHEDRGVTIFVEIPVIEGMAKAVCKEKNHDLKSMESRKILAVDDEEAIRTLLKIILESKGHKVDLAENGYEAINKIKRKKYDLVISDLKMPELGGKELYNLLRAENPAIADKILFITGDTVNSETAAFLEKTGNHFLKKPFESEDLMESIWEALSEDVH